MTGALAESHVACAAANHRDDDDDLATNPLQRVDVESTPWPNMLLCLLPVFQ